MAKKLGKLAFLGVLAGATAGACYYYYQNKGKKSEDVSNDSEDLDDFDDDFEDEDFSSEPKAHSRITIDLDNAKDKIGGKVIETLDKTKDKLDKAKEFIGDKISPSASDPEYTEMDITSGQASDEEGATSEAGAEAESEQSAAYSEEEKNDDVSENLFAN
jgi:hypothetical protein